MGYFLCPRNDANLIDSTNFWAEATVHTQHGTINNGSQDEEVKDLAACLPHGGITIFLLAFFVEAIYLCYLSRFMVAPY